MIAIPRRPVRRLIQGSATIAISLSLLAAAAPRGRSSPAPQIHIFEF